MPHSPPVPPIAIHAGASNLTLNDDGSHLRSASPVADYRRLDIDANTGATDLMGRNHISDGDDVAVTVNYDSGDQEEIEDEEEYADTGDGDDDELANDALVSALRRRSSAVARSGFGASRSSSCSSNKKFSCQFNGGAKNGRVHSLVLRFDANGDVIFKEMNRAEVLRMTQDAAQPKRKADSPVKPAASSRSSNNSSSSSHSGTDDHPQHGMHPRGMGSSLAAMPSFVDVQCVHARDLRKLNNAFAASNDSSIVVRKQAILLNADPVRAILMRSSCLVFVPDGADSLLALLQDKFREQLAGNASSCLSPISERATHTRGHQQQQPTDMASGTNKSKPVLEEQEEEAPTFEFHALEALLSTLSRHYEAEYDLIAPTVVSALDRLAQGRRISSKQLEAVRNFKTAVHELETQVDGVRRALMELLDNEEDLRLLYLTKLHDDPTLLRDLYRFDSEQAEVLVENYLHDIFSTRTKATLLQHRIQNTESLVMLKLDAARNYLMGMDLLFSLVAISLSIGTYVTGVFGMNLDSSLQERAGWFWGVVGATGLVFIALMISGILFFRRKGVFL